MFLFINVDLSRCNEQKDYTFISDILSDKKESYIDESGKIYIYIYDNCIRINTDSSQTDYIEFFNEKHMIMCVDGKNNEFTSMFLEHVKIVNKMHIYSSYYVKNVKNIKNY